MPRIDIDPPNAVRAQRSIEFSNLGTAEMVYQELKENLHEMRERKDSIEARFNEEVNGHEAVMRDLRTRIVMIENAVSAYEQMQPVPESPMPGNATGRWTT